MKQFGQFNNPGYVYLLTNKYNTTIYTGVSSELISRISKHKAHSYKGFSSKYNVEKLVYYKWFESISAAIAEEKRIKAGSRKKKIDLINSINPDWKDLYNDLLKKFLEG